MAQKLSLLKGLNRELQAVEYALNALVTARFKTQKILTTTSAPPNELLDYASAGHCKLKLRPNFAHMIKTEWESPDDGLIIDPTIAHYRIEWRGASLDYLCASWQFSYSTTMLQWIVADDQAVAERFLENLGLWAHEVRGEVLVFQDACWSKSKALYTAISGTSFDDLILPEGLKSEIAHDFSAFLASRTEYERYGVPWKRGVLLLGPPGNGKTHCVKGLVNKLKIPCLYVRNFKAEYTTQESNIRKVFAKARKTTPCLLVLEDLDSLLNDENRAYFLNELDGFAQNTGIIVLATTNHPEKLDASILERPSRFDRKYHFTLPVLEERARYIRWWNGRLEEALRSTEEVCERLAQQTEGFSNAYIKELFLSSLMRWINERPKTGLQGILEAQLVLLRSQMQSGLDATPQTPPKSKED